eukprot:Tbor_TRINITY_DN2766_c0_g1::TRINITY_DN2766_c0_g1_i1::g.15180::m.15180/K13126/PABPC; polyadenylate-binding protein
MSAEEISPTTVLSGQTPSITSIYVGDLSPDVDEPELLELFKTCGVVLGVRILRDILTRRSLGYGYVNFQNAADAEKALETLNFKTVKNCSIRLMYQQRDPTTRYSGSGNIFVKNLDVKVDSKSLHEIFNKFGSILSCKVMSNADGSSRGYGFVHFKEDSQASNAITAMNGAKERSAEDEALYVAQFIRRNNRIAALMANFTNVYIKQVLPNVDKDVIEKFFSKFGGITSACAKQDAKGRTFAFCNFSSHDEAVKAIEEVHAKPIDGLTNPEETIYVQRAQPRNERLVELRAKSMQRQSLGNNLYVRNFGPNFTDEQLRDLFVEYGDIKSCRVMTDDKGTSRGFGFVSFISAEQANIALRELNGRLFDGKPLVVNIAQRRDQRFVMLQAQFQQRIQALMHQLPVMPFIAGGNQNRRQQNRKTTVMSQELTTAPKRQFLRRGGPEQYHSASRTPMSSPAMVPLTPTLAPITEVDLLKMPINEAKSALGERLFVKIAAINCELAPKITGMFLEMDIREGFALLQNAEDLKDKVNEAMYVIHNHQNSK